MLKKKKFVSLPVAFCQIQIFSSFNMAMEMKNLTPTYPFHSDYVLAFTNDYLLKIWNNKS